MQPFTLSILALCLLVDPANALCGRPQTEPVSLGQISARGELILQDGRVLRLAGIEDRGDEQARALLTQWLTAQRKSWKRKGTCCARSQARALD